MGNVKVTSHFNKNGRMTGYGSRSTSNARKFLSQKDWKLCWCGRPSEWEVLYSVWADGELVAYLRWDENYRKLTQQLVNKNMDIDIDVRKAIQAKQHEIDRCHYQVGDMVKVGGETAEVTCEHKRVLRVAKDSCGEEYEQHVNIIEVTYNHTENVWVDLNTIAYA